MTIKGFHYRADMETFEKSNMAVDYALYLVTDSTKPILGDRDLVEIVQAAVKGGTFFLSSGVHPFFPRILMRAQELLLCSIGTKRAKQQIS